MGQTRTAGEAGSAVSRARIWRSSSSCLLGLLVSRSLLEGSERQAGYLPDCKSVLKVDLPSQTAQLVLDSDFKELNCFHMSSMRL